MTTCRDVGNSVLGSLRRAYYYIVFMFFGFKWSLIEVFTKHKKFDLEGIAPRSGQVVITGGAKGIGLEVIKKLLQCEMDVIMGCRSVDAGVTVINAIRQSGITTGKIECLSLDLMNFQSVRQFASEVLQKKKFINLLINNAGIMGVPYQLTKDGYESQLQVNHFGHFLLINLLLPKIIKTSQMEGTAPRIVNVNSIAMLKGDVYYDDFPKTKFYCPNKTYTDSKLFAVVTANYLDRKFKREGTKVKVFSLHPGIIPTNLWDSAPAWTRLGMRCVTPLFRTVQDAAEAVIYAAFSPEIEDKSGIFLINSKEHKTVAIAHDVETQDKLWECSCKVVEIPFQQ